MTRRYYARQCAATCREVGELFSKHLHWRPAGMRVDPRVVRDWARQRVSRILEQARRRLGEGGLRMNECRKWVVWGLLVALVAVPASAHDAPRAAQAATATVEPAAQAAATSVDAFHAALVRGDQSAAVALLADDALIFESGGAERSKAEYASHHLAADAAFAAATTRTVSRRSGHAAGDLAWIATESTTTGTFRDRPVNSVSTETMVLRRTGDTWRIVHIHWSSAKAE